MLLKRRMAIRLLLALAAGASVPVVFLGQHESSLPPPRVESPQLPQVAEVPGLSRIGGKRFPIDLPSAMRLGNVRGLEIELARRRLQVSSAQLQGAKVLWLPSIVAGVDYNRHDGPIQEIAGPVIDASRSSFMIGGSPTAVFAVADAIFQPLAARQMVRARQAETQAAANDTMLALTQTFFNLQQARGELAGYRDAQHHADELMRRLEKLAPGLTPTLEVNRARALTARLRQVTLQSENNWRVASAELLRILYLDPNLVVDPVEPPHLRVSLLPLDKRVDDLVPVALTNRPELAAQQALVQASLRLLRLEKLRPLVPSILLRGWSTPVTGTLGFGYFGGGVNGNLSGFNAREDWDIQALWTLQNLGFGNRALIRQKTAENRVALTELFRVQDRVAAEVVQAYSQAQTAEARIREAEAELKDAQTLVREDLAALGQTQRLGEGGPIQLVARPLEVVAALQMLQQAYADFYSSINDYNRAQFQLYRALGNPAESVLKQSGESSPSSAPARPSPTLTPP